MLPVTPAPVADAVPRGASEPTPAEEPPILKTKIDDVQEPNEKEKRGVRTERRTRGKASHHVGAAASTTPAAESLPAAGPAQHDDSPEPLPAASQRPPNGSYVTPGGRVVVRAPAP